MSLVSHVTYGGQVDHQLEEPSVFNTEWQAEMLAAERKKERRVGYGLLAVGVLFFALGAFAYAVRDPWVGAAGMAFGFMGMAVGVSKAMGGTSPAGRIALIIGCAAFAITGALALISGIVAPEAWGWRGGGAGIFAGLLTLGFFGPGTIILLYREYRLRRNQNKRP